MYEKISDFLFRIGVVLEPFTFKNALWLKASLMITNGVNVEESELSLFYVIYRYIKIHFKDDIKITLLRDDGDDGG